MSIQSAIEALSPVQYYRLNELASVTAHDSGSAGQNGTYDTGVDLGLPGPETGTYAAQFQRSLSMKAILSTLGTGDQTLLFWCCSYSRPTNQVIAGVGVPASSNSPTGWTIATNGTGGHGYNGEGFAIRRNSVSSDLSGTTPDDQWHMVAVSISSGGTAKLYLDGQPVTTLTSMTRATPVSTDRMFIGPVAAGPALLAAHLAWWLSLLTDSQILGIYNARAGPQQFAYQAGQFASANNNIYASSNPSDATLTTIQASQVGISDQVSDVATNLGLLSLAVDVVRTTTNSIFTWVSGWPDAATSIAGWLAPKVNDILSRLNAGFPSPLSGLTPGTPHTVSGGGFVTSSGRGLKVESFTVPAGWGHFDGTVRQWVPRIGEISLVAPDASSDLVEFATFEVINDPLIIMYQGTLPTRINYSIAPGCTVVLTEFV